MMLIRAAPALQHAGLLYIYQDNGQDEEGTLGLDTSKVISILTGAQLHRILS